MKKILAIVLCVLLLVPALAFAETDAPRVIDESGLLSETERQSLTETIDRIRTEQQFDVVVLIPKTLGFKSASEYADDYYDQHGYGYGIHKDGILLLVCLEERDWATSTKGAGIDIFDDSTLYAMEEPFVSRLSAGNYYQAFSGLIADVEQRLKTADRREVLYLDDAANTLSASDRTTVAQKLEANSHVGYYCDSVVLTVSSLGGQTAEAYAESVFDSGNYRYGSSRDKVILVVDMGGGKCYCLTQGDAARYFDADALRTMEANAAQTLSSGSAAKAFTDFSDAVYGTAAAYFADNTNVSRAKSGPVWFSWMRLLIVLAVGAAAGGITAATLTGQMKSVHAKAEANQYVKEGSFRLKDRRDLYLYSNVTRTPRNTDSGSRSGGGGGGAHFSSGGGAHGGHSGKF